MAIPLSTTVYFSSLSYLVLYDLIFDTISPSGVPASPVGLIISEHEEVNVEGFYNPHDTEPPSLGNLQQPQSSKEEERLRNAAAVRDIAREIDMQLGSPTTA
ncbi:hypothetical protein M422DRAFT_243111 [Sphaerobolus stellatus SS14]|nr:hypothetical protein M422DRAFT_243111 [Sphaerobolus stellatus SS14]